MVQLCMRWLHGSAVYEIVAWFSCVWDGYMVQLYMRRLHGPAVYEMVTWFICIWNGYMVQLYIYEMVFISWRCMYMRCLSMVAAVYEMVVCNWSCIRDGCLCYSCTYMQWLSMVADVWEIVVYITAVHIWNGCLCLQLYTRCCLCYSCTYMKWLSIVADVYEMVVYVTTVHIRTCCLWLQLYTRWLSILAGVWRQHSEEGPARQLGQREQRAGAVWCRSKSCKTLLQDILPSKNPDRSNIF
jgi:hypothetical protein